MDGDRKHKQTELEYQSFVILHLRNHERELSACLELRKYGHKSGLVRVRASKQLEFAVLETTSASEPRHDLSGPPPGFRWILFKHGDVAGKPWAYCVQTPASINR